MRRKINSKIFMFIIYSGFVILGIFSAYQANDLSLLNDENSLYISNKSFEPDLSMHEIDESDVGMQEYRIKLNKEEFSHFKTDTLVFFINKLTDNAYSVKLNGTIIGREGDIKQGHSMFKNSPNHFSFDKKFIEDENEIVINTNATYKSGLESEGIYITDSEIGMKQIRKVDFFGVHLIMIGMGFLIFSIVLMVFIYYINEKREIGFLYCAMATVFATIYFVDYIKVVYLPFSYFTYKKIFMISLYIAFWFYMLAMSEFLKCRYLKHIAGLTAISFIIMSFFADTFILYKKLYSYWYLALLINILLGLICSLVNLKKIRQAFIFASAFLYATIYASLAILIEFFDSSFSINSPLVYMVIFSSLPLLFGFEELIRKEKQISYEKKLRKSEYINSVTDNLTGAWNQRYLHKKLQERTEKSILTMIDIDDFKLVNDNYGHLAGDFILKEFTKLIINTVRKTDDVCRYGGDEFIVILYDCNKEEAYLVMENLRKKVEEHDFIFEGKLIKITMSVGIYETVKYETVNESLKQVDNQLYVSKESGKNNVSMS